MQRLQVYILCYFILLMFGQTVDSSETSKQKPTEGSTGVILVDPGRKPHKRLRYHAKIGQRISAKRTTITTIEKLSSDPIQVEVKYEVRVVEVDEHSFTLEFLLEFNSAKSKGKAIANAVISTTGRTKSWSLIKVEGLSQQDLVLNQQLSQILSVTWLPEEPVGIGARWLIKSPVGAEGGGIRAKRKVTMNLKKREEGKLTLLRTVLVQAEPQAIGTRKLLRQESKGDGIVVLDLAGDVPVVARKISQVITVDQAVQRSSGFVVNARAKIKIDGSTLSKGYKRKSPDVYR